MISQNKQHQPEGAGPVLIGLSTAERRRRNRASMIAAILETAIAIMREAGVADFSLHEVGRRVGMRAQSLYKYFPSKAALLDALFAEGAHRLLESDRRVWDHTPADWSRLEAWLTSRLAFAREEGPLYELTTSPSAFGFEWSSESRAIAEAIGEAGAEAIQELIEVGLMRSDVSPRRAMNLLLAANRGTVGETVGKEQFLADPRRLPDLVPDFVSAFRANWSANIKKEKKVSEHFTIQAIDHLEVSVPDRYEAAEWYGRVLGLEIMHGPTWDWAVKLPQGPLFVGGPDGEVKVSLFEGEPLSGRPPIGLTRAAFRVDGDWFISFAQRLDDLELSNDQGVRVTRSDLVDHRSIWAYYFSDPYGNRYELNTYDYDLVRERLPEAHQRAAATEPG